MKKLIYLMLGCAVLFTACQKKSEPVIHQKPVVKIGFILPLSGNVGAVGEGMRDGALMAKEDFGKTKFNYEFLFEDDQLDGKQTIAAAQKLIHVDKVDVIVSATSGSGNIVSSIAKQNKVIHFGIATDPNVAAGPYNFTHCTPPTEEAKGLLAVFLEKKIKRVAALIWNQEGALSVFNLFQEKIKGTDIKVVSFSKINTGERDFRLILEKTKQLKPDIYFLLIFPPELEIAARQFKELNIRVPMTTVETFSYSNEPSLFEGMWFIDQSVMSDEVLEKFRKKYNRQSAVQVGNMIDVVNLLMHAYENSPSMQKPSTEEIADALLKIKDYDGILGKLSIDPEGIVQSKATLQEIRNGKPVVIKRDL